MTRHAHRKGPPPKPWKTWEGVPADIRLLMGTLAEREAEAKQQGIEECWETRARRNATGELR
jgi:hypothetical protein